MLAGNQPEATLFGFKKRRRKRLRAQPFPESWCAILKRNVPYYRLLAPEDQTELQGHIHVFLAEKQFEGLGGLTMTDEIRVTIAAQACILLLHRQTDYYPSLMSILVYPHEYVAKTTRRLPDGTVAEGVDVRLGESWHRGSVVLSWNDVLHGAADVNDGQNVVFHEFAHQLDSERGGTDGAPALPHRSCYLSWARVFTHEYEQLIHDLERNHRSVLNKYGATNPAEFFAVATEAFFEKPTQLKRRHPELYEQLSCYFEQSPAELFEK